MKTILAAFFSGLAGRLGLGGGGVLVLYLVLALGMPQLKAQGINLLFFIPCAVLSSIVYSFKKLIDWKSVLLFAAGGLPGVLLGSLAHEQQYSRENIRRVSAAHGHKRTVQER